MKNKIEFSGYKYNPQSINVFWNGIKLSDYLMEKFDIRYALCMCDYEKAIKLTKKAIRFYLKKDNYQQVGLLMEDNTVYTFRGCFYNKTKSNIKDRFKLYKRLLAEAEADNYEFTLTQRAELGKNFTIENVKNNTTKITKRFVKCN